MIKYLSEDSYSTFKNKFQFNYESRSMILMELTIQILDELETPIILFNRDGNVRYANQSAHILFGNSSDNFHWPEICDQLPEAHIHRLQGLGDHNQIGIMIECTPQRESMIGLENQQLKNQVDELESIIHASSDELFVTDGEGRVLLITKRVKEVYDLTHDEIVGRTVFELEKEGVFYPSVTALVLRDHKRHTILQTTRDGRYLTVTGNPLFDENGVISRVISTAIDIQEMPWVLKTKPLSSSTIVNQQSTQKSNITTTSFPIVASSELMRDFIDHARHIAKTDATILLLGETGVGKNRLARYIHSESPREDGPFVEINCSALPEPLIESELFGYERGAFTGSSREGKLGKVEIAHRGTLFLNEIGELPLQAQAKLLDFIQERQFTRIGGIKTHSVDIRIISATNRDLKQMVQDKLFREDLFYRLHVVPLEVPPLRDRIEDIEALCLTILTDITKRYHLPMKHLHQSTYSILCNYSWPGNVRELENVIERICVSIDDTIILPKHLPKIMDDKRIVTTVKTTNEMLCQMQNTNYHNHIDIGTHSLQEQLDLIEMEILKDAIARWKTTYTIAEHLKISQPTVVRKLKHHGLSTH